MPSRPSAPAGRLPAGVRTAVGWLTTRSLRTTVLLIGLPGLAILGVVAWLAAVTLGFGSWYPRRAVAIAAAVLAVALLFVHHHPSPRFGAANWVTLTRAALMALLAGAIGEATYARVALAAACVAGLVPILDGIDGRLARRFGTRSSFGARFDVEIDALHVLAMSALVWHFGKAGIWIWLGGLLRYGFVAAGWLLPWMSRELLPTRRGRVITVVHMATVSVALAPFVPISLSMIATALTTAALVWSFAIDIGRLWRGEGHLPPRPGGARTLANAAFVMVAFVLLSQAWSLPLALGAFGWRQVASASLEVTALFGAIAVIPRLRCGRTGRLLAACVALSTMLVTTLRLAELGMLEALDRHVNPMLDVFLIDSLALLLTQTLGTPLGQLALTGLALVPLAVGAAAFAVVRVSQSALRDRVVRVLTLAACAAFAGVFVVHQWRGGDGGSFVTNDASVTILRQVRAAQETARGITALDAEMAEDRFRDVPPQRLLAGLRGVDVLLIFIESYGRSAVDMPPYAAPTTAALTDFEGRLAQRGLGSVSGWLTSPTVGGQSWLPSGTFVSGLWLADQGRYDIAMQSDWLTLPRAFGRAGYRTVALKPAITAPWPEGGRLGFERVYVAADLGYAGKPYNWVTMPDQYTLSAFQRTERATATRPLFAEISLISSHAPWTPVAEVLEDWTSIGDGRVFSKWADAGDPPHVVWRDPARIRAQYPRTIDYVLRVLASYVGNFVDGRTLVLLVGDHQPAPVATGGEAGRDVPIHVISGDATLLEPFKAWGLTPGMHPPAGLSARRMDTFRNFFLEAFQAGDDGRRRQGPRPSEPDRKGGRGQAGT